MVVYPRWRGELDRTASVVSSGSGLSPLARGTPVFANLWTIAIRFIPAGAGNTGARNTKPCICSVYPRWRGEHWLCNSSTHDHVGLSPLARGTRAHGIQSRVSARFIPAGAGNTGSATAAPMTTSVYPRWRGEHEMLVSVNAANTGLSPLARGTHYAFLRLPGFCRFIPAGAGNTRVGKSRGNRTPVYPRWRGEHTYDQACAALALGLSPLARGTPNHAPLFTASARFIPAGAGNTP